MDFTLPYHQYCENAVGLLQQPYNFISAFAYFIVAGWIFLRSTDRDAELHQVTGVLVALVGCSALYWHYSAQPLGLLFDIITALLLAAELCTVICSRLLRWPLWGSTMLTILMMVGCVALMDKGLPFLTLNGGAFLPPLFLLAIAALAIQPKNADGTVYLLSAAYCLFFAVILRSADLYLCGYIPIGTHFLSHIFAAICIVYVMRSLDTARGDAVAHRPHEKTNIFENDILSN